VNRASNEGRSRSAELLATLDEIEVEVEKLVAGGDGLARYRGVPIFVPRSVPGDRLRVSLVRRRPDYGRAEIVEILHPGEGRREPPCAWFERCGGCDLQQIEDGVQLRHKSAAVRETLERIGGVEWPESVETIAGEAWGYRLRTQLHGEGGTDGVRFGYYERGSRRLVPVTSCPVLAPELEALLADLPRLVGDQPPPHRLDLATGDRGVTAAPPIGDLPRGEVELRVGDFVYRYDARCFFQAHRGLAASLVERVVGEWEGESAVDLYAGVGLFSLPLARRYGRVTAVEGDRLAVRHARANARHNRLETVEVIGIAVESWITRLAEGLDRIVVDPPRAGLSPVVRQLLVFRPARRLTYVSCHAATLARDLRALGRSYRLESLVLIDLFPQTGHLEVVAHLAARD
jgi:23S rRNA (uracil1939-C5)-methyltransferase